MKRFCSDMKKYWHYIVYAGQSELKTEVANSYLNWLWWIIEPFCFMLIYSFVFVVVFASKVDYVQVFIYIGITLWTFFNNMVKSSVHLVRSNKSIVSKVYMPKYILIFVKMYVNGFKMFISLILLFILIIFNHVPFTWYMLWIIPIILVEYIVTFGICTFLLHFGVFVDDLSNVTNIVLRMMFYLTGVFYDLDVRLARTLGDKAAIMIGNFNPIASFIISTRNVLLHATGPNLRFLVMWFVIGLILSIFGICLIYKNENSYVKVI